MMMRMMIDESFSTPSTLRTVVVTSHATRKPSTEWKVAYISHATNAPSTQRKVADASFE